MGMPLDTRDAQAVAVIDRLHDEYPDATISLNFTNRLELLVAVILSAQCTDERVNEVTENLFEKYPTVERFAEVSESELAEDIGSITYPNQKAGWITTAATQIVEEHNGKVPDSMAELTELPGVGRKTANVVLHHGHDVIEGIVVDTHVMRLAKRLGLTDSATRNTIEKDLMEIVPEEDWRAFTHLLISHGRAVCSAQNPACEECVIEELCPSSRLDHAIDLATGDPWNE